MVIRLWARWSRVDYWHGWETFLFSKIPGQALGSTQSPNQWVPGNLSVGVKQLGCRVDHSPPSSAEVSTSSAVHLFHLYASTPCTGTTLPSHDSTEPPSEPQKMSWLSTYTGSALCNWNIWCTATVHWEMLPCLRNVLLSYCCGHDGETIKKLGDINHSC
jgi:hypothetical protein